MYHVFSAVVCIFNCQYVQLGLAPAHYLMWLQVYFQCLSVLQLPCADTVHETPVVVAVSNVSRQTGQTST